MDRYDPLIPAKAAQQPTIPVIGYLNFGSPEADALWLTGLRWGLNEIGYVEGRNFVIEYRWAGNQADRLPALMADLVQLRVTVIVAAGLPRARGQGREHKKSVAQQRNHQ